MFTIAQCSGDGKYLDSKVLNKLNKSNSDIHVLTEIKIGEKSINEIEDFLKNKYKIIALEPKGLFQKIYVCVLVKLETFIVEKIELQQEKDTIYIKLRKNDNIFRIYCVYLNPYVREKCRDNVKYMIKNIINKKKIHFILIGDLNITQDGDDEIPIIIKSIGGTTDRSLVELFTNTLRHFGLDYKSIKCTTNFLDCLFATGDLAAQCIVTPNIFYAENYNHRLHKNQSYEISYQCEQLK